MKKGFVIGLVFFLLATTVQGQNLVPNAGFDTITTCNLTNNGDIIRAQPWFSPSQQTPDLFNSCASNNYFNTPQNCTGWQYPLSGSGYAGIGAYNYYYPNTNVNSREYIEVKLRDTLTQGKKYCVEFYASLADSSFWAINRLGAFLSIAMVTGPTFDTISKIPQIQHDSTSLLQDKTSWIKISGGFIASGGEQYLTIGNFYADNQTDTISHLGTWIWAYYYIDNVSVIEIADCVAGNNTEICRGDSLQLGTQPDSNAVYSWQPSAGLSNSDISNPKAAPFTTTTYTLTQTECDVVSTSTVTVTVKPDCNTAPYIFFPTIIFGNEHLNITGLESNSQLEIYDSRGRLVFRSSDYQNDFITDEIAGGLYVVRLVRPNGESICQKLCIIH